MESRAGDALEQRFLGRITPGATVPVRFDPAAPNNVAIDFRAMGFAF